METSDQSAPRFTSPVFDEDDIQQEFDILTWQGKKPSKRLLRLRAARYEAILFEPGQDIPGAEPIEWAVAPYTDFETIQRITDWALQQSEFISQMVLDFLEEPTTDSLEAIITNLQKEGILSETTTSSNRPVPLTQAILSQIRSEGPTAREDLYSFARGYITSKRPEAAVRQTLRRLVQKGILKENDNVYSIS